MIAPHVYMDILMSIRCSNLWIENKNRKILKTNFKWFPLHLGFNILLNLINIYVIFLLPALLLIGDQHDFSISRKNMNFHPDSRRNMGDKKLHIKRLKNIYFTQANRFASDQSNEKSCNYNKILDFFGQFLKDLRIFIEDLSKLKVRSDLN